MRTVVIACSSCALVVAAFVACAPEEYPNPPATRDGTEKTDAGTPTPLAPSNPPGTPSSSSSSPGAKKDAGADASLPETKPVGPTSGVDQEKTLGALTSAEKKQLCDWQAGVGGGYGKTTKCDGGLSFSTPKNQTACVQKLPGATCAATVAEFETCIKVDADDPCALALFNAPECKPLRDCAN